MSDAIISAENLGKKYLIGHQTAPRERYTALRDVIVRSAKELGRKTRDIMRGRQLVQGSEVEEFWVLRNASFEVKQGEVLGIIGRNGAGKSTLLKILSRITEPSEGRVVLRGRVASLLEVGTGFHPELTGRENIFLNGAILGMTKGEIRKKFDEIVAFAEVEKFLDTPVKHYSSGMYVRLAFAVAAHLEPEILVVDEVLAVGDAEFQKKCLGKMGDVAKGGRTVLFVSHNMTAVRSLCQRAILLDCGTLKSEGATDGVIKSYLKSAERRAWHISWPNGQSAPGNGRVWLNRVEVVPEGVKDLLHVPLTAPLHINIEFFNSVPENVLNVSLVLYTADGICVLNTISDSAPRAAGLHRAVCQVPGGFLNDETYRIRVLVVQDGSRPLLDKDHLLYFELQDVPRESRWFGRWVGVVRPSFDWCTQHLSPVLPTTTSA